MKRKLVALGLVLTMALGFGACGSSAPAQSSAGEPAGDPVTIYVSAAASMTESLDKVIELYKEEAPNVTIVPTYDSSGTLLTQIQEGADCDIFISAAQKQMNALDETSEDFASEQNYVLEGSRVDLLENKCALIVNPSDTKGIDSWDAFVEALKAGTVMFAMGNSDVPVGQYTSGILENLGLAEADLATKGIVTYGSNVKEVTSAVSSGAADCGIVYVTDAFSAGLDVIAEVDAEIVGKKAIYPAAVMSTSQNAEAAQAFLDFLQTEAAMAEFTAVGFSTVA